MRNTTRQDPAPSKTWVQLLDGWTSYQLATGVPESTMGLRLYYVRRLATAFPDGPASISFEALVDWIATQSWGPETRRSFRTSVRSLWKWLLATGQATESPAQLLPPVKVPRGRPRPTPEVVFRRALTEARESDKRIWLAIELAGVCGLRRSEVAKARREHVEPDLVGYSLRVTGKGGHVRLVPLPDSLAEYILDMPDGWLFPSSHGGHLTAHHLAKLVSRTLGPGLTMHTLRHRSGTVAYAGTKDIRAVQELLGHSKPETTARYTAVPDADVRAAMMHAAA